MLALLARSFSAAFAALGALAVASCRAQKDHLTK